MTNAFLYGINYTCSINILRVSLIGVIILGKGLIKVFCGEGQGKTTASLGHALVCAGMGKKVIVVQFLKGKQAGKLEYFTRLEPEIKVFRFEKEDEHYVDLCKEGQEEEVMNILNGINFAKKVLITEECDLLVLDEILGLIDLNIITLEDVLKLIEVKDEEVELILTGQNMPDALYSYVDYVCMLKTMKNTMP